MLKQEIMQSTAKLTRTQREIADIHRRMQTLRAEIEKTLEEIEHDRKIESDKRGCKGA